MANFPADSSFTLGPRPLLRSMRPFHTLGVALSGTDVVPFIPGAPGGVELSPKTIQKHVDTGANWSTDYRATTRTGVDFSYAEESHCFCDFGCFRSAC